MNRSILIVICDFLLVSLLAFSTVDINQVADATAVAGPPRLEMAAKQSESARDLNVVMRQALDEERKNRDLLMGELAKTRDALTRQQAVLSDREQQVQAYSQQLQTREQEAQRLQQQQIGLQARYADAQGTLSNLNQQLQTATTETVISRERLAMLEAEARKQREQAEALSRQLSNLQQSNQVVAAERERLSSQLQVAEVERRHATEQASKLEQEVKSEREEKAKLVQHTGQLAEGVKALANRSGEIAQEIRENRPLAPNTIYDQFLENRVHVNLTASRSVLFGSNKHKESDTVLVSSGTNTYALLHVDDTPLTFWTPGTDWEGLKGVLTHGPAALPVRSMVFLLRDPRVVLIPIPSPEVAKLGVSVYQISSEPYKFQDAVLVGQGGYYGECRFQIDPTTPGYVRLDNNFIKGLFGKFNPSRGDMVFSKTGELLGLMVNSSYGMMLQDFHGAASLQFTDNVREQRTGIVLSQLHSSVTQLPLKLQ
jgi:hypothetical protein